MTDTTPSPFPAQIYQVKLNMDLNNLARVGECDFLGPFLQKQGDRHLNVHSC